MITCKFAYLLSFSFVFLSLSFHFCINKPLIDLTRLFLGTSTFVCSLLSMMSEILLNVTDNISLGSSISEFGIHIDIVIFDELLQIRNTRGWVVKLL